MSEILTVSQDVFPTHPLSRPSFTTVSDGIPTRVFAAHEAVLEANRRKSDLRTAEDIQVDWDMFSYKSEGLCEATGENLMGAFLLQSTAVRKELHAYYQKAEDIPEALKLSTYLEVVKQPLVLKIKPNETKPQPLGDANVLIKYFPGAVSGVVVSGPYTGCIIKHDRQKNVSSLVRLFNQTPLYGDTSYLDIMPYGFARRTYEPGRYSFDERDKLPALAYLDWYEAFVREHNIRDTMTGVLTIAKLLGQEINPTEFSYTQVIALERFLPCD